MSKAILVMDMPKSCDECNLYDCGYDTCMAKNKYVRSFGKPDWCPMRELPQKQTIHSTDTQHHRFAKDGYNACIDDILKGSEENGKID